ncbi:MAG TPA: isopentenyl transferase family protein, partial [Gaiellales bacterium]
MRPVVALFGPTASGKTATAIALAERGAGEVVAADAMGLYAGLPTLTAQPTADERARAPHRLVGVWPLDHEGAVGEYAGLAHEAIDEL